MADTAGLTDLGAVSLGYGGGEGLASTPARLASPALSFTPGQNQNLELRLGRVRDVISRLALKTASLSTAVGLYRPPDRTSLTQARLAVSSAPESFQAAAGDEAELARHHVSLTSLAAAQANTGYGFLVRGQPALDEAAYTFELTHGGDTHAIEVSVGVGDDTPEILWRVARQIRAADEGLWATVERFIAPDADGVDQEYARLSLASGEPGQGGAFALEDTSGELVETLGLGRIRQAGAPGRLSFDLAGLSTDENPLELEGGALELSLLSPTSGVETLTVEKGHQAWLAAGRRLVGEYNEYLEFLAANQDKIEPAIARDLAQAARSSRRALKDIGLLADASGRLSLTSRFEQALASRPERVSQALAGENGFLTQVRTALDKVLATGVERYARQAGPAANPFLVSLRAGRGLEQSIGFSLLA